MSLTKDLVFLVLQFLDEENLQGTAHMLEHETGYFFDVKYFEDILLNGNWDEAERYLSGFTKVDDNRFSTKIYFEIRKQKFLEALDMHDHNKALDIFNKDLKVFRSDNEELFKEIAQLLILDDIREHPSLSIYGDTKSARRIMAHEVMKIVEANPLLYGKLHFPKIRNQRLRRLINQSLNWQHIRCTHPQPDPHIKTLFVDHVCQLGEHSDLQSFENNLPPSQDMPAIFPTSPASWTSSPSTVTHSVVSGAICLGAPTNPGGTFNSFNSTSSRDII
ncbi:hypothetical protein L1049_013000 [Liquidambar formosana]|uniref:CTLH domain-containing protein n=1 Tax=Liquidambar formosana TaxID=63359 RepID=A0AAP0RJJ1_LIQFO